MQPEKANRGPKIQSFRSALCDWFIILCLLSVTAFLESPNRIPYHQCVPGWTKLPSNDVDDTTTYLCGDTYSPELQYPYKPNSIDEKLLMILAFGPWIVTLLINTALLYCSQPIYRHRAVLKHIEIVFRMLMFSAWSTEALVSIIKFSVGRPRPNFYALMDDARTEKDHKQARMSFPSGHTSLSFSILFLLTLLSLSAMHHVQSSRFRQHNKNSVTMSIDNTHSYFYLQIWWRLRYYKVLSLLLVFVPTYVAIYIACTRITDYWHHYGDVLAGAMIGIAGASVSFMVYRDELYSLKGKKHQQPLFEPYGEHDDENIGTEYDIERNNKPSHRSVNADYVLSNVNGLAHALEVDDTMDDSYAKMDHDIILEKETTDTNMKSA